MRGIAGLHPPASTPNTPIDNTLTHVFAHFVKERKDSAGERERETCSCEVELIGASELRL